MTHNGQRLFGLIALAVVTAVAICIPSSAEARAPRAGAVHATARGEKPRERAVVRPPAPPRGAIAMRHGGVDYHFLNGSFYRWGGAGFVVSRAPIGAALHGLKGGYIDFVWAGQRFRLLGDTWLAWSREMRAWVVVPSPLASLVHPRFASR